MKLEHHCIWRESVTQKQHPLRDILCKVSNALKIIGDAQGPDDFPEVDRDRLPPRDGRNSLFFDFALECIHLVISPMAENAEADWKLQAAFVLKSVEYIGLFGIVILLVLAGFSRLRRL
jgi:hypothetical protein